MPINRRINVMSYKHTVKYYSALKSKQITTHDTTLMKPEDSMLEIQSQKDKYGMIPLI